MVTRKVQKQTLKITIFVNYLKKQSVTYHFYFLVGKLSKFFKFKDSMTKSYLADFKIQRKKVFYSLLMAYRKLHWIAFPETSRSKCHHK